MTLLCGTIEVLHTSAPVLSKQVFSFSTMHKIRTRAIVDALVVNGMKNKLVVDSETKKNKWEELSTPEVVNDVEN